MDYNSGVGLKASLLPSQRFRLQFSSVAATAAPLLLSIAGSGLSPLACAFSLSGVSIGTVVILVIGIANNYTSVLMVRAASRLGVSGYEEVVLAAGGRQALQWCRVALIVLLFGTMCGSLAAIQETGARAMGELATETGYGVPQWLSSDPLGRTTLLVILTVFVVVPLSLASLGEMMFVSLLGVALMVAISAYLVFSAVMRDTDADADTVLLSLPQGSMKLTEAASIFGFAWYVQPYPLPLLRALPPGEQGAATLVAALHVTFVITGMAYLSVGLGGLFLFGEGHVPQDVLQGFHGRVGGTLAGAFCLYLMLCFAPNVVPLRETLVRLYHESPMDSSVTKPMDSSLTKPMDSSLTKPTVSRALNPSRSHEDAMLPSSRSAVLPPLQNAAFTAALVGSAFGVAAVLPDASAQIFALTGATGVCAIGYVFPIYSFWCSPEDLGGARSPSMPVLTTASSPPHRCLPEDLGGARRPAPADRWPRRLYMWLTQRAWPTCVLFLGCAVSILTLIAVFEQWAHPAEASTCEAEP
jgi:hypothetical protein